MILPEHKNTAKLKIQPLENNRIDGMGTLITLIIYTNEIIENPVPVRQFFYRIWCLNCIVLTYLIDKVYKKIPKLAKITFRISLTFTSEPMTDVLTPKLYLVVFIK